MLDNKYKIEKTDGSLIDPNARYLVLRLDNSEAGRWGAKAFADCLDLSDNFKLQVYEEIVSILGEVKAKDLSTAGYQMLTQCRSKILELTTPKYG